jgi:hypothetical protein
MEKEMDGFIGKPLPVFKDRLAREMKAALKNGRGPS